MGSALIRTKVLRDDHLATTFVFTAVVGTVAYVYLTLSAGAIASYYGTPELTAIIPFEGLPLLIASFLTIQQALLARGLTGGESLVRPWASRRLR